MFSINPVVPLVTCALALCQFQDPTLILFTVLMSSVANGELFPNAAAYSLSMVTLVKDALSDQGPPTVVFVLFLGVALHALCHVLGWRTWAQSVPQPVIQGVTLGVAARTLFIIFFPHVPLSITTDWLLPLLPVPKSVPGADGMLLLRFVGTTAVICAGGLLLLPRRFRTAMPIFVFASALGYWMYSTGETPAFGAPVTFHAPPLRMEALPPAIIPGIASFIFTARILPAKETPYPFLGLLFLLFAMFAAISPLPVTTSVAHASMVAAGLAGLDLEFIRIARRVGWTETLVFGLTTVAAAAVGPSLGVLVGVIIALVVAGIRHAGASGSIHVLTEKGPIVLSLSGPLTFVAPSRLSALLKQSKHLPWDKGIVFDMRQLTFIDSTGAELVLRSLAYLHDQRGIPVAIKGLGSRCRSLLQELDSDGALQEILAVDDHGVAKILGDNAGIEGVDWLTYGASRFQREGNRRLSPIFEALASSQHPHTLFITCADSRIKPGLITSSGPGDIFLVRNVGNLVPPHGQDQLPAEGAAIEFAVGVLGVKDIVVCGHSTCGAMKALCNSSFFDAENCKKFPNLTQWLGSATKLKNSLTKETTITEAAKINAVQQLDNLQTYPIVQAKLKSKEIRLHAWYYDIGMSSMERYDEGASTFVPVGATPFPRR